MTEDLSVFFADFGVDATLNGSAVRAIVDTNSEVELDGILTQLPSAVLTTAQSASASAGQAFVANSVTYSVRQVRREPPDGILTRLVLTR
jgi:hypothetical protein